MDVIVEIEIPGRPLAQGRGQIVPTAHGSRIMDPKKSRTWKAVAQDYMRWCRGSSPIFEGPLQVEILATFACPRSEWRKREPQPRRWCDRAYGDADNISKAVLDAGNSVLWLDDRQVARLISSRIIGAQGEPESVRVRVSPLVQEAITSADWRA